MHGRNRNRNRNRDRESTKAIQRFLVMNCLVSCVRRDRSARPARVGLRQAAPAQDARDLRARWSPSAEA